MQILLMVRDEAHRERLAALCRGLSPEVRCIACGDDVAALFAVAPDELDLVVLDGLAPRPGPAGASATAPPASAADPTPPGPPAPDPRAAPGQPAGAHTDWRLASWRRLAPAGRLLVLGSDAERDVARLRTAALEILRSPTTGSRRTADASTGEVSTRNVSTGDVSTGDVSTGDVSSRDLPIRDVPSDGSPGSG